MPLVSTFPDRRAAGRALARAVALRHLPDPVVLALPRGGVPVAFEVAQELGAPLDLVMVRKIGAPGHSEYAIGAIVDGDDPEVVIDRTIAAASGASQTYITQQIDASLKEIRRRRAAYGVGASIDLAGRTAIVVDDGVATGSTVMVALKAVRKARPRRIVLAVPVAPADTFSKLRPYCDEIICLLKPRDFYAVGAYYDQFGQTSDAEVVRYLELSRSFAKHAGR